MSGPGGAQELRAESLGSQPSTHRPEDTGAGGEAGAAERDAAHQRPQGANAEAARPKAIEAPLPGATSEPEAQSPTGAHRADATLSEPEMRGPSAPSAPPDPDPSAYPEAESGRTRHLSVVPDPSPAAHDLAPEEPSHPPPVRRPSSSAAQPFLAFKPHHFGRIHGGSGGTAHGGSTSSMTVSISPETGSPLEAGIVRVSSNKSATPEHQVWEEVVRGVPSPEPVPLEPLETTMSLPGSTLQVPDISASGSSKSSFKAFPFLNQDSGASNLLSWSSTKAGSERTLQQQKELEHMSDAKKLETVYGSGLSTATDSDIGPLPSGLGPIQPTPMRFSSMDPTVRERPFGAVHRSDAQIQHRGLPIGKALRKEVLENHQRWVAREPAMRKLLEIRKRQTHKNPKSELAFDTMEPMVLLFSLKWFQVVLVLVAAVYLFDGYTETSTLLQSWRTPIMHARFTALELRDGSTDLLSPHVSDLSVLHEGCEPFVQNVTKKEVGNTLEITFPREVTMSHWSFRTSSEDTSKDPVRFSLATSKDGSSWMAAGSSTWMLASNLSIFYLDGHFDTPTARNVTVLLDHRQQWPDIVSEPVLDFVRGISFLWASIVASCLGNPRKGKRYLAYFYLFSALVRLLCAVFELSQKEYSQSVLWWLYMVFDIGFFVVFTYKQRYFLEAAVLGGLWMFISAGARVALYPGAPFDTPIPGIALFFVGVIFLALKYRMRVKWVSTLRHESKRYDEVWEKVMADTTALHNLNRAVEMLARSITSGQARQCKRAKRRGSHRRSSLLSYTFGPAPEVDASQSEAGVVDLSSPEQDLDKLFAQARGLHPFLLRKVQEWAHLTGGCFPVKSRDGIELKEESVTQAPQDLKTYERWCDIEFDGGKLQYTVFADMKGPDRATEKLLVRYNEDASKMLDIARQKIFFLSLEEMERAIHVLKADPQIVIVRCRNRMHPSYNANASAGYRSILMNLRIVTEETMDFGIEMHVCELQLVHVEIAKLGDKSSHTRYIRYKNTQSNTASPLDALFFRSTLVGPNFRDSLLWNSGSDSKLVPDPIPVDTAGHECTTPEMRTTSRRTLPGSDATETVDNEITNIATEQNNHDVVPTPEDEQIQPFENGIPARPHRASESTASLRSSQFSLPSQHSSALSSVDEQLLNHAASASANTALEEKKYASVPASHFNSSKTSLFRKRKSSDVPPLLSRSSSESRAVSEGNGISTALESELEQEYKKKTMGADNDQLYSAHFGQAMLHANAASAFHTSKPIITALSIPFIQKILMVIGVLYFVDAGFSFQCLSSSRTDTIKFLKFEAVELSNRKDVKYVLKGLGKIGLLRNGCILDEIALQPRANNGTIVVEFPHAHEVDGWYFLTREENGDYDPFRFKAAVSLEGTEWRSASCSTFGNYGVRIKEQDWYRDKTGQQAWGFRRDYTAAWFWSSEQASMVFHGLAYFQAGMLGMAKKEQAGQVVLGILFMSAGCFHLAASYSFFTTYGLRSCFTNWMLSGVTCLVFGMQIMLFQQVFLWCQTLAAILLIAARGMGCSRSFYADGSAHCDNLKVFQYGNGAILFGCLAVHVLRKRVVILSKRWVQIDKKVYDEVWAQISRNPQNFQALESLQEEVSRLSVYTAYARQLHLDQSVGKDFLQDSASRPHSPASSKSGGSWPMEKVRSFVQAHSPGSLLHSPGARSPSGRGHTTPKGLTTKSLSSLKLSQLGKEPGGPGSLPRARQARARVDLSCPVTDLSQLYNQAAVVQCVLRERVKIWAEHCSGYFPSIHSSKEFVLWRDAISDPVLQAQIKWAKVKGLERAIQKQHRSYHGDVSRLLDIVRENIVFDNLNDLLLCLKHISRDSDTVILRIKNRFDDRFYDSHATAGYRDLALNLRIVSEDMMGLNLDGHVVEVQLILRQFGELKSDQGHRRYVAFRDARAE